MLIDLNKCVAPKLYVMDGIVAMEGNGPGSGDPVQMNVMLMSTDPVALDSVFSRLVYLKPEMVPTNYHGAWSMERRGEYSSYSGWRNLHVRGSKKVWESPI